MFLAESRGRGAALKIFAAAVRNIGVGFGTGFYGANAWAQWEGDLPFAEGSTGLAPQHAGAHIKAMSAQEAITVNALRELWLHRVSMALQSFGLTPHRPAPQNISYGLTVRG